MERFCAGYAGMATADVTIYGAGVFGLSVAWSCLQRGARVRVIDPYGVGAGASGGVVGALAPHTPDQWNGVKAFQLHSLSLAEAYWAEVTAHGERPTGYARLGRIQPLLDEAQVVRARIRSEGAREFWNDRFLYQVVGREALDDFIPESPTGLYIRDTLSARINPRWTLLALAKAVTAKGGEILFEGEARGKVVWCTGYDGLVEDELGNGVKGQAAVLGFDAGEVAQVYAGSVHIVPHANGTVVVGSTSEREFDDESATDSQLDEVIAQAVAVMPQLAGAPVVERWAGVRPRSLSRQPILGAHPKRAGEFIANGGFKIGFGMAPKIGEVMAALVLEGKDEIPSEMRATAG